MKYLVIALLVVVAAFGYYKFFYKKDDATSQADTTTIESGAQAPSQGLPVASNKGNTPEGLLESGQYAEAQKLLSGTPKEQQDLDWKIRLIQTEIGLGNQQKALDLLTSAITEAPAARKAELLSLKSDLMEKSGKSSEAVAQLFEIVEKFAGTPDAMNAAMKIKDMCKPHISSSEHAKDLVTYNKSLSYILEHSVDATTKDECYDLLGKVNLRLFFSPNEYPGIVKFHKVAYGENLEAIAKKYKIYTNRLVRTNNLSNGDSIRENQLLRVIMGRVRAVVDRDNFRMNVYLSGLFFKSYIVGIGKEGKTPALITKVSNSRAKNPVYTEPSTGVQYPFGHVKNPIGTRWIGFTDGRGLGIHGTNEPDSVGKDSSNGCIRLRNPDVEEVYDYIIEGDEIVIN